ncbi:MAG: sensor histidine kinase [Spirochaetaceae bacterium]
MRQGKWIIVTENTSTDSREQLEHEVARLRKENAELKRKTREITTRSDLLLQRVLDVLPVGVFIADEKGGIAWTNAAVERIWGGAQHLPIEKLTEYKGWWADTGEPVEEWALGRAFSRGESSFDERIDIECFDGSRKTILNSAVPVHNETGEIVSAVAVVTDITELRETEAALRMSEERLNRAMSIESVGVLFFDMESTFLDANDAFLRMIGHDRAELERGELSSETVTLPEWMPKTREVFEELKRNGRFKPYEKELVRPDGTKWWGLFAGARLDEREAVEFVIDITERKQVEEQREAALKANRQLMRELNHRVKNHLLMVSTLVNFKDQDLGTKEDLSDIRGQISTIAHIHDTLYQKDAVETVAMGPYVSDLLTDLFSFHPDKNVELTIDIGEITLQTDKATALGLILNEIATNAIKHGFPADETPRFLVRMEEPATSESYLMTISQNGPPIPEDVELTGAGSSGLGLIRALVSQIGGTLELERHPSPTFKIRIPVE